MSHAYLCDHCGKKDRNQHPILLAIVGQEPMRFEDQLSMAMTGRRPNVADFEFCSMMCLIAGAMQLSVEYA